ncbi:sulfide dehydrogenase, cytochrome subunit [Thioalkalivibrio nitratireducens DSM 14787]|uniref:Sulfide dehydrogenase, cytochrome subunit n=1 Tax=Thioalkalivibrio nitratireducens (strain DSM 14787 / UNIQEM 213 / ALEN2) TaxID=1255043 RepID=L0DZH7_THIND|nr:sulfide dehydrogenase cytochrome subunit [Thioalkalivibrio nitratireducens]AGA34387.1 sulfide dehydrogenase, cytochrome subunit [Thioalkalivibrio nitratireducens DSM 14787]
MNRRFRYALLPALALVVVGIAGSAGANDLRGSLLAGNCYGWHGPNGDSQGGIPSLSGLDADQIAQTMLEFRSGARESTVMQRQARGYSEDEIASIAQHIAHH